MNKTKNKMMTPKAMYKSIRDKHPDEPFGRHWESVGVYLDGECWADPDYLGCPGEYQFLYLLHRKAQDAPQRFFD